VVVNDTSYGGPRSGEMSNGDGNDMGNIYLKKIDREAWRTWTDWYVSHVKYEDGDKFWQQIMKILQLVNITALYVDKYQQETDIS